MSLIPASGGGSYPTHQILSGSHAKQGFAGGDKTLWPFKLAQHLSHFIQDLLLNLLARLSHQHCYPSSPRRQECIHRGELKTKRHRTNHDVLDKDNILTGCRDNQMSLFHQFSPSCSALRISLDFLQAEGVPSMVEKRLTQ